MIQASNPAILFSENVPNAQGSISYNILLKELKRLGYDYKEMILDEKEGGCLEKRKRYWFVAYSKGLDINPESIIPPQILKVHSSLGDVMQDDTETDLKWFPLDNLNKRHNKNIASGRGFKINLVDNLSESVTTIPRSYAKHQVSNPHITDGDKQYRLLTPVEHARVKRIPEHLVAHCHATTAHQGLGQSIAYHHAFGLASQVALASRKTPLKVQQKATKQLELLLSA
jgi:DNA (cytosine-5)-methyltransferase 1